MLQTEERFVNHITTYTKLIANVNTYIFIMCYELAAQYVKIVHVKKFRFSTTKITERNLNNVLLLKF